jgi:hypothetical protein
MASARANSIVSFFIVTLYWIEFGAGNCTTDHGHSKGHCSEQTDMSGAGFRNPNSGATSQKKRYPP